MRKVAVKDVEVGDILAAPVFRQDGGMLVDAGVEITKTLLRALEGSKVKQVMLVDDAHDLEDLAEEREANDAVVRRQRDLNEASENQLERHFLEQKLEDLRERLGDLYRPHADNRMMMDLHDAALAYLSDRLLHPDQSEHNEA